MQTQNATPLVGEKPARRLIRKDEAPPQIFSPKRHREVLRMLGMQGGIIGGEGRNDAGDTSTFSRELEHVLRTLYMQEYPELKARQLIPINGEAGPGARTVTHQIWNVQGKARLGNAKGDDIPLVQTTGAEASSPIVGLRLGYAYDTDELREAVMTGRPIDRMRGDACREIMERTADDVAAVGDSEFGLVGLFKNSNVPTVSPVTGTWTASTTSAQMLGDLTKLLNSIPAATKNIHYPNALILGTDEYNLAAVKEVDTTNRITVLQALKDQWRAATGRDLMITSWVAADLADAENDGPRAVAYVKDPKVLFWHVTLEFVAMPPQLRNFQFVIPCEMRLGGVDFIRPKAAAYMDGL
ncbi:MAG: DUF2184 domain-containing protein [Deltaproteobacteria bacterium]|nr:DUF2184 domain-containing protein [Deltaproteobacteria bacterium]